MAEYYSCKLDSLDQLNIFHSDNVRWLDLEADFDFIRRYYKIFDENEIIKEEFCDDNWRFCALIENNEIVSFARTLYMTSRNWEIGAVSTHPQFRNKGYAKIVCSFVAKFILDNGKQATCNTYISNYAMQKVMQQIGMVLQ